MRSLFPPRESLVSDIQAGDGNIETAFFTVLFNNTPFCRAPIAESKVTEQQFYCILISENGKLLALLWQFVPHI
jgi:hypothetical protein